MGEPIDSTLRRALPAGKSTASEYGSNGWTILILLESIGVAGD
jgi:hypothetical protein